MAEQPIKSTDIIENGLFNDAIKQADVFLTKAKELEVGLKANLAVSKEYLNTWTAKGSGSLQEQAKVTNDVSRALKDLEKIEQATIKTQIAKQKLLEANEKALRQKIQTEQLANKESQRTYNESLKLNSAYEQLKKRYNDLSKAQMELDARGRSNGVVFRSIKDEAVKLRSELDRIEQGAGRFQRNVGNYASSFNGLGNAVNQLTREAPAFAVSMNTGFLAISNNLPILFDNLQKINKENAVLLSQGKPIESAFQQLGKAVFSMGTVLSLSVTLLTLFGGKLVSVISSLFDSSRAFDLNTEAMKSYNEELERTQNAQDDLDKSIGQLQKDLIANEKLVTKAGSAQLDAIDKASDAYINNEKARKKAVAEIIVNQLKAGDKELEIATRVNKGIIEIENKKTGEIIRLDKDAKNVLTQYSAFYNRNIVSQNEKAIQDKLDVLNKETKIFNQKLDDEYTLAVKNTYATEGESAKIRQKFSDEDYIRRKSALEQIRQLQIDAVDFEQGREEEQILFNRDKALDAIDEANKIELVKKQIAQRNYLAERELIFSNVKDTRQQNIDLLKLKQDYYKEVKKIESENLPVEQQIELRIRLEIDAQNRILEVKQKYRDIENEAIQKDFEKTIAAREKISDDNTNFEIYNLEKQYAEKQKKLDAFSLEETNRLEKEISAKKVMQIQANADEKKALTENEAEKLAIQNEANIAIEKETQKRNESIAANNKVVLNQALQFEQDLLDAISKEMAKESQLRQESFNKEISDTEQNIETQRRLAEKGKANTLAEEEARKAQIERQKQLEKEEEIKRQKVLAFFKLYAAYAENDPDNALQKALKDTILAEAVSAAFIEGTENVGQDAQFNKHKFKSGEDGYLARFDGRERILNPKQNAKIGNMSNDELADLAHLSNKGLLDTVKYAAIPSNSFADNVANSALLMETVALKKEMQEIKEAIKSRPVSNFTLDGYGNFISETIENGFKKVTTHKIKKPRLG